MIFIISDFYSCSEISTLKATFKYQSLVLLVLHLVESIDTLEINQPFFLLWLSRTPAIGKISPSSSGLWVFENTTDIQQVLFDHLVFLSPSLIIFIREIQCMPLIDNLSEGSLPIIWHCTLWGWSKNVLKSHILGKLYLLDPLFDLELGPTEILPSEFQQLATTRWTIKITYM